MLGSVSLYVSGSCFIYVVVLILVDVFLAACKHVCLQQVPFHKLFHKLFHMICEMSIQTADIPLIERSFHNSHQTCSRNILQSY